MYDRPPLSNLHMRQATGLQTTHDHYCSVRACIASMAYDEQTVLPEGPCSTAVDSRSHVQWSEDVGGDCGQADGLSQESESRRVHVRWSTSSQRS